MVMIEYPEASYYKRTDMEGRERRRRGPPVLWEYRRDGPELAGRSFGREGRGQSQLSPSQGIMSSGYAVKQSTSKIQPDLLPGNPQ